MTADAAPTVRADRRAELIAAARHLLETEGAEAITIRRLGAAVGIRGPSVYKHVPDKARIEDALAAAGLAEQADALQDVPATFTTIARAYRTWALSHPHMHRLINDRPLNRAQLPVGLEDRAAAPLVAAYDGDRDMARAAWATIKGLVDLELADRFPPDTDIDAIYAAASRAYATARLFPPTRAPRQTGRDQPAGDPAALGSRGHGGDAGPVPAGCGPQPAC
ncbi:TetR/AcrR family transcriptional regulator [Micromonospora endolithica]|uniref:TetR/AcrR family transcriptional regulator n=1 Tax=Micromonospora endolithica TaxID=230091 RepID=A0A3A9YQT8_9ACTN|nr:TetR/AcrR family transcriptional regulator [Micromonospora endolithica]RKN38259.1 TetR/AcrR family transcriptional regulator [Micromonospora endolithica]TWJ25188.1 TetR family transcriptional regulator [Micromonospora endolithica]